ncbi:MAG TPA: hypothetical protein VI009_11425 [Xanthobacteraceae bacterium]
MRSMPDAPHRIAVRSETAYIEEQSSPETNQFVFAYTITIENTGTLPAKPNSDVALANAVH